MMVTIGRPGVSKRDWLEAGMVLLTGSGAPSVTLEKLCARMGLSRGSFYHHFSSIHDYRTDLLTCYEAETTTAIIALTEQTGATGLAKLLALVDVVDEASGGVFDLENAFRAWATSDAQAAQIQERIDRRRISYVREVCAEAGYDQHTSLTLARMFYGLMVGAGQLRPALTAVQQRELYSLLGELLQHQTIGRTKKGTS